MSASGDPNNYSVKEILTDFVMPALDDLRNTQRTRGDADDERFRKLESFRDRAIGAFALITAILIPVALPVIITILSTVH